VAGIILFDLRGQESMPKAEAVHLTEEMLCLPFPWHLGKLVDRRDKQRGRTAVDVFVYHHHRQSLFRCLSLGKFAVPCWIPTVRDAAANVVGRFVDFHMMRLDLSAAPRTGHELVWRPPSGGPSPDVALTKRFCSLLESIRCRLAAYP